MKRTTVFADEADLAVLKAAAARRGTTEAELLRHAVHLVALAERVWEEPVFRGPYAPEPEPLASDDPWASAVEEYERTKGPQAG